MLEHLLRRALLEDRAVDGDGHAVGDVARLVHDAARLVHVVGDEREPAETRSNGGSLRLPLMDCVHFRRRNVHPAGSEPGT